MKIKQIPEDFIVKEILNLPFGQGDFFYYKLRKKNWNTKNAISHIAQRLNIQGKRINFSGLKDKQAVTEQYISIFKLPHQTIEEKDLGLEYLGQGKQKVETSLQEGNEFILTVRDLENQLEFPQVIPNYFDDQRFGTEKQNHIIGKLLLQRKFQEAATLLKLEVKNNDHVGALKKTDVVFFINAYQSYLFNLALSRHVKENSHKQYTREYSLGGLLFAESYKNIETKFPIVHFDFEAKENKIMAEILEEEQISTKDFIIKQFPEAIAQTVYRPAFIEVKDFKTLAFENDELNQGKKKQVITFKLPRGSYATMLIKSGYIREN